MLPKALSSLKGLFMNALVMLLIAAPVLIPVKMFGASHKSIGPTEENALAADQELAKAIRDNDTTGMLRLLDKGWAVISATGGVGEGPSIFPDGVKSGYLTRKTLELSEPRVRLYGNIAVVTTKVNTSGTFRGKPFDIVERQTDVLRWEDGGWKCVLTHETKIKDN
jgi:ketosteroid isomerase-like protein